MQIGMRDRAAVDLRLEHAAGHGAASCGGSRTADEARAYVPGLRASDLRGKAGLSPLP
jgi:hypothetical protein